MGNPNVGSWIRAELDDTGKLTVRVYFTAAGKENGNEVLTTRHEDVNEAFGADACERIKAILAPALDELTSQLSAKVAVDQVEFMLRNANSDPRQKKLLLAGNVKVAGETDSRKH